ncbi:flagellar hook protein FlgE [Halomonas sp. CUBES01]|uniref:Flagellar hook protein FlgE n=1 Tax=Vreelandella gomseomensis TaxID=370766 RepID=A0ABU1GCU0_9GAMM|nr:MULTISPECIES: flagellar hook protein FlgE [Halomonas]MDR5875298.1 flagellar hook protein FlgE [Halomonas gomseomensis]MEC4765839.1 flagellar hook protein FlgE [Halomonas sp. CUBES01]
MSFSQALSGLNAQQDKLGAVGNNIANSQTVGFKSSNVQFADVYAESRIGLGTRTSAVLQNFSQGNIESSNRNMDLAIAGEGFFRFQQPNGEVGYSRNGQLTMTAEGDLVNAQGAQIMGYPADDDGNIQGGGDVEALSVDAGDLAASATTELDVSLNLDAEEEVIDPTPAGADINAEAIANGLDSSQYSYSTNGTIYDSQGNARNLTMYFTKIGANDWRVDARMSGGPAGAPNYAFEDVAGADFGFTTDGRLNDAFTAFDLDLDNPTDIRDADGNAVANSEFGPTLTSQQIQVDFPDTTQFANSSTVNDLSQDGYTSGSLVGVTIEDDGSIMRNYSNEESRAAGQIALVSFRNPEGLSPDGDNLWTATGSSGQELVGAPGTGQRGLIEPGAVETSNVDMAGELVDMIVAQRAYQANSQTISTQDELLQTIINL